MTHNAILKAEAEAKRFLQAAKLYHESRGSKQMNYDRKPIEGGIPLYASSETAALKRASMDLTKALAAMRKYN